MFQPVASFPLSKRNSQKVKNSYYYLDDVLASETPSLKNARTEIEQNRPSFTCTTALDCWKAEQTFSSIPTMSKSLDKALGHGVKLGSLIELCGLPGNGKTQLCLQLCVSVQIPMECGGLAGQSVYIDTASNFTSSRLKEMATDYRKHLSKTSLTEKYRQNWVTSVMSGVHYIEVFGMEQFYASLALLNSLLEKNKQIKLVIIDSITFPFKHESNIYRVGMLVEMALRLKRMASNNNIAIIITNEMSMKIGHGITGALGDVWSHCTGTRMTMSLPNIVVTHNSDRNDSVCQIQVTKDGIRDSVN